MRIPAGPVIALVITVALAVGAEILLGWLAPFPDPYLADKRLALYVPSAHLPLARYAIEVEEGLPGVTPVHPGRVNVFTTNGYGFRGDSLEMPKPADEVRVFLVGGSSTENLTLDDSQDMGRLLQDSLQRAEEATGSDRTWKVYNAGKSGDRSYDHLAMISQRITHLQPDIIVVFAGINDMLAGIFGVDYTHMSPVRLSRSRLLQLLASESQLFRRAHAVARQIARRSPREIQETIAFKTNYAEKAKLQRNFPEDDGLPPTNVPGYERALRSIAAVGLAAHARVVFMTQATSWTAPASDPVWRWQWMRRRGRHAWSAPAMHDNLELYNNAMRRVVAELPLVLVDLPRSIEPTSKYFFDDVHFNDEGARTAAAVLLPAILQVEHAPAAQR